MATSNGSFGAGDSYLIEDLIGEELKNIVFKNLLEEVEWNSMRHRGKLAFSFLPYFVYINTSSRR